MTLDLQRVLALYVEAGWVDASLAPPVGTKIKTGQFRGAYLVLASSMMVWPGSEVQVTARCWWPFKAHKMIVAEDSARFDLIDLSIGNHSQFTRLGNIPLCDHVGIVCGRREEVRPEPIRWPLSVCTYGGDASVRAIIRDGKDPGAEFEIVLLGEAI